jgi:hypothetical protein
MTQIFQALHIKTWRNLAPYSVNIRQHKMPGERKDPIGKLFCTVKD